MKSFCFVCLHNWENSNCGWLLSHAKTKSEKRSFFVVAFHWWFI